MTRYCGGKNRIGLEIAKSIYDVVNILSKKYDITFNGYIEPFVGMAGVYRHIPDLFNNYKKVHSYNFNYKASDINPSVILMWKDVQQGRHDNFPKFVDKELYDQIKDDPRPSSTKGFVGCANTFRGIYLSTYEEKTSNNTGAINRVMEVGSQLQNVQFTCCNYDKFNSRTLKNYILYLDPPYTTNPKYYDEERNKLSFNHHTFWKWALEMSKNNLVFMSEYEIPKEYDSNVTEVWTQLNGNEKLFIILP